MMHHLPFDHDAPFALRPSCQGAEEDGAHEPSTAASAKVVAMENQPLEELAFARMPRDVECTSTVASFLM